MNIGIILAAGHSTRFGGYINKQYLKLNGKEVVSYSIAKMKECNLIDEIILVVDNDEFESKYIENKYKVNTILGGKRRNTSIRKAIDYINKKYKKVDKVIFHDSVRPLIEKKQFDKYLEFLDEYEAVITTNEITDALATRNLEGVERSDYMLVQTPEAFRFKCILDYDEKDTSLAIINQYKNLNIKQINQNLYNMKITHPEDLFMAEQLSRLTYTYSNSKNNLDISSIKNVLLFGSSGGIGKVIKKHLQQNNINVMAPNRKECDLLDLKVSDLKNYTRDIVPDVIINAAASYSDDKSGILEQFDEIFKVNLKSNLVIIEYAKTLNKRVNIIVFSSSSSTKGRVGLTNYSASKSALNSIVESLAPTLIENGIVINALAPEKVKTPLIEKLHKTKINDRELLSPKDIIENINYYMITNDSGNIEQIRKGI